MSREDTVHVDVEEFVAETDKALLVKVADGREVWVPVSICSQIHREKHKRLIGSSHQQGWITVENWFAKKESLL